VKPELEQNATKLGSSGAFRLLELRESLDMFRACG